MTDATMTDDRTPDDRTPDDRERLPPSERGGQELPRQDREEGGYGSPNEGGPGGHGDRSGDEGDEES